MTATTAAPCTAGGNSRAFCQARVSLLGPVYIPGSSPQTDRFTSFDGDPEIPVPPRSVDSDPGRSADAELSTNVDSAPLRSPAIVEQVSTPGRRGDHVRFRSRGPQVGLGGDAAHVRPVQQRG